MLERLVSPRAATETELTVPWWDVRFFGRHSLVPACAFSGVYLVDCCFSVVRWLYLDVGKVGNSLQGGAGADPQVNLSRRVRK